MSIVSSTTASRDLLSQLEDARRTWPDVRLETRVFLAFVASKRSEDPSSHPSVDSEAAGLSVADLFLSCAALNGDPAAVAAIERDYVEPLRVALLRRRLPIAVVDDVLQAARIRLFVVPRKIASYDGRGPLKSWLRVLLMRDAIHEMRRLGLASQATDELGDIPAVADDPELAHLKRLYRHEFALAFAAAVGELSNRQRNVLRQHTLLGVSIDGLATMYHVHRATAARWLEGARAAVLEGTRRDLRSRLQLTDEHLASVLRLIESQLDASVRRLLST